MTKRIAAIMAAIILAASMTACNNTSGSSQTQSSASATSDEATEKLTGAANTSAKSTANTKSNGALDTADLFTDRDMTQTADTSKAKTYTLSDSQTINITSEGVYVIKGSAGNVTVTVDAADEDKVQIVLDGATITNDSAPCIYVKNADKVFVTTTSGSENSLTVSGTFSADGDTNTDAAVYAKDDLVINGQGKLSISSTQNGITSKDDLKITGGTISISCTSDGLEANESAAIAGGEITVKTDKDGVHVENKDDNSKGYFYMCGGTLNITAGDDGIRATTVAQVDGGTITTSSSEGIEATYVQINDGTLNITATDDGINTTNKSTAYSVKAEFNGGKITISMGQGDTDAIDSNGDLAINGGTLDITAQSPFDYDGTAEKNGGTIIVNGTETDTITNQFMGGGMGHGDMGGQPPMQDGQNDQGGQNFGRMQQNAPMGGTAG